MKSSWEEVKVILFSPDDSLLKDFKDNGIEALWIPLLKLTPRRKASLEVLRALEMCEVVAFTSPRTLTLLLEDSREFGAEAQLIEALKNSVIGVVGPKTSQAVMKTLGRPPDIIAQESYGRSLAKEIAERGYKCVVAPRSAAAVKEFDEELAKRGVKLVEVVAYEPKIRTESLEALKEVLRSKEKLVLVLTSSMIADIVCEALIKERVRNVLIVNIGTTTADVVNSKCPPDVPTRVGDGTPATLIKIVSEVLRDRGEN
ncbi:MAG: uroporphyrinogen-III synthase [Acidilobaceae archaeon]